MVAKRTSGNNPPEGSIWFDREAIVISVRQRHPVRQTPGFAEANCIAWKGHEIVAALFFSKNIAAALIVKSAILFFVRVNQVLVRLWARVMEAGFCLVFVPLSG
jgi:hypothetical protein